MAECGARIVKEHYAMARNQLVRAKLWRRPGRRIAYFEADIGMVGSALPGNLHQGRRNVQTQHLGTGVAPRYGKRKFTCAAPDVQDALPVATTDPAEQPLGQSGERPVSQAEIVRPGLSHGCAPVRSCSHAAQAKPCPVAAQETFAAQFALATRHQEAEHPPIPSARLRRIASARRASNNARRR